MSTEFRTFTGPVDPDLFLWCSNVYSAAAHMTMPVENPATRPAFELDGSVYSFSDLPINRGMLAVMRELKDRAVSEEDRMAFATRLMHFGAVLQSKKLQKFMKQGEEPGALMVSEALIRACATAKMKVTRSRIGYVVADVARIAQQLTDEEEANAA